MPTADGVGHPSHCTSSLEPKCASELKNALSFEARNKFVRGFKARLSKKNCARRLSSSSSHHPLLGGIPEARVRKRAHGLGSFEESRRLALNHVPPSSRRIRARKAGSAGGSTSAHRTSCPHLERFSWQPGIPPSKSLPIKPRHIAIEIPELSAASSCQPSLPLTPKTSPSRSHNFSRRPSLRAVNIGPSNRPLLPHFRFPDPNTVSRPHSPPWTDRDVVYAARPSHRPSTPPQKSRIRILPDTPESLPSPAPFIGLRNDEEMAANGVTSPSSSANIAGLAQQVSSSTNQNANSLSSLVCNVNRTTGERPPPLVGASSTILGDKMYVFGGRRLSRSKPNLTNALYEIDLITRHWRKLRTAGNKPIPRYFHSMNALGDTRLVCFGGMASGEDVVDASVSRTEAGMVLLNDLHMYDIATGSWTFVQCPDAPRGRYAHCAVTLPSTTVPTTERGALPGESGQRPGSTQGGVSSDGRGGAQLVVIGGQTPENKYVMEINVYNFRSRRWERTDPLQKEYGAYRSVAIPLTSITPSQIGSASPDGQTPTPTDSKDDDDDEPHSTLIYSNYNFLDVKLEFCLRTADGALTERGMRGAFSPPGLRFPNGDVYADHFILSGTFLTSTRKEYALWALDLKNLTWQRIDVGPGILTSGSWNRGLLWKKRNMYVIFGDRRRKLDQDYNHRRLNFANMMTVELEAYGLYTNPVVTLPAAKFLSASSPFRHPADVSLADMPLRSDVATNLGRTILEHRELCDLDLLALGGERIAVNSQIIARRWGPYLLHLLQGSSEPAGSAPNGVHADASDSNVNGRPLTIASQTSRNSSITITPGLIGSNTTAAASTSSFATGMTSAINSIIPANASTASIQPQTHLDPSLGNPNSLPASTRPRVLYLPHIAPTVRALVHYLYTWALPPRDDPLCTAQILCSLLQIARPYRIDGLLEAVVERLHEVLEAKNTAAVFNAAAMAAGGGDAVAFTGALAPLSDGHGRSGKADAEGPTLPEGESDDDGGGSVSSSATSLSGMSESGEREARDERWTGKLSSVVGLQKRGLRGLMEGRRMREQGGNSGSGEAEALPSSGT